MVGEIGFLFWFPLVFFFFAFALLHFLWMDGINSVLYFNAFPVR
jgi:hypothetical protein